MTAQARSVFVRSVTYPVMGLRDSLSTVTATASDRAAEAGASLSAGAAEATATAAEKATTARDAAATVRERAADELPERLPEDAPSPEELASTARSYSAPAARLPTARAEVRPAAREVGVRALGLVRTVDFEATYRYGKRGFEYGGTYGRFVPFGNALPYVGLLAGLGAGVLESADVVSVETLLDLTEYAPAAVERLVDAETAAGGAALADGVDAADSPARVAGDRTARDLAEMDYDEFADR